MELKHSGNLENGIKRGGTFGGFLFFAATDCAIGDKTYLCNVADLAIAEPRRWQYDAEMTAALESRVAECAALLECSEDDARDALCDRADFIDGDKLWAVQRMTCEIAREVGYAVVMFRDEHGTSYAIDALNEDVQIVGESGRVSRV